MMDLNQFTVLLLGLGGVVLWLLFLTVSHLDLKRDTKISVRGILSYDETLAPMVRKAVADEARLRS